jgi:hypothetical protein
MGVKSGLPTQSLEKNGLAWGMAKPRFRAGALLISTGSILLK